VQPKSAKLGSSPPPKAAGKGTSLALKPRPRQKGNFPKRIGPASGPVRFVLAVKNRLLQRNQCPGSRFNIPYRKD
jgi:hypothetical protein